MQQRKNVCHYSETEQMRPLYHLIATTLSAPSPKTGTTQSNTLSRDIHSFPFHIFSTPHRAKRRNLVSYTINSTHSQAPTPIIKCRPIPATNEDINYSRHFNSVRRIPKTSSILAPISNYGDCLCDNSMGSNSYFLNLPSVYSTEQELQVDTNRKIVKPRPKNMQIHRKTPSFPGNMQKITQIKKCEFNKIFNPKIKCTFPKINQLNAPNYEQRDCFTERGNKPIIRSLQETSNPFIINEEANEEMKQTGCFDVHQTNRLSAPPKINTDSYFNVTFKPMKSKKLKTIDRIKIQEHQMLSQPIILRSSEPLAKGNRNKESGVDFEVSFGP